MRTIGDTCPTCGVHGMIGGICSGCGLPKEICSCSVIEKETAQKIKVKVTKATYGKLVTIITGIEKNAIEKVAKQLKKKMACGGTVKDDQIILQGDHKSKLKKALVAL